MALRESELPDWLDAAIEGCHGDIAIALPSAFVEVQALAMVAPRPSVPNVHPAPDPLYEPVACENYG